MKRRLRNRGVRRDNTVMAAVPLLDGLMEPLSRCLTPDEDAEYEALINAADFIAILKLKARQQLNSSTQE